MKKVRLTTSYNERADVERVRDFEVVEKVP